MPAKVPIRRVFCYVRILPLTRLVINRLAQRHGIRANKAGVILDHYADMLEELPVSLPARRRLAWADGRANLTQDEVRVIRKSRDKNMAIAEAHRVSYQLVGMIKAHKIYKWVK